MGSLITGNVIGECMVDDVPDEVRHSRLAAPDSIMVELVMKGAPGMFEAKGSDVSEIFPQPRAAQDAALRRYDGTKLVPWRSPDFTREDTLTGKPRDLSKCAVRERARKSARGTTPFLVIGSPPCTIPSSLQNWSKSNKDKAEFEKAM